jgi:hypothetical protein
MAALAMGSSWLACNAQAALTYSYAFDQASYTVGQGQTVSVPVYFQESVSSPDVSKLATQNGLGAASVLLELTSGAGVQITGIAPNPLFDGIVNPDPDPPPFPVGTAYSLYATTLDPLLASDPIPTHGILPTETPAGSDIWRVLLGSFSFTASGNPGDSATFQATMPNTTSDVATWDALYGADPSFDVLANGDGLITSPEVSFTIVPEPGSLALSALAGLALAARRRARLQR